MTLSAPAIKEWAERLDASERTREQVGHLSLAHPGVTIEDAYAVQHAWVEMKLAAGRTIRGHKIGLTSRAMQRFSNIDEPDYGALLDDMFFADGSDIPMSRFIVPHVEVELAFVLKHGLSGPRCTMEDVLAATDYVVPAIEIIDYRIRQVDPESKRNRKVMDTISDNAACGGVVASAQRFGPREHDMRWISAIMFRNDVIEDTGVAAAVLNHPANGPAWLANKLYPHGVTLKPGEFILGGSFTSAIPARAGDTFNVDYGPFGEISVRFV